MPIGSLIRHGRGHIPDSPDSRDFTWELSAGKRSPLPYRASLRPYAKRGLDQLWTSSCVGFAAVQGIFTLQGAAGIKNPLLASPLPPYRDARQRAVGRKNPVFDTGSQPRLVMQALRDLGLVAWNEYPFDPSLINAEIPYRLRRLGIDRDWLQYYRIRVSGANRCEMIRQAIVKRKPVLIGLSIDDPFDDLRPSQVWKRSAPITGRHMVAIVGYDGNAFEIANSWGSEWGDDGCGLISADAVGSFESSDATVLEINWSRIAQAIAA